MDGINVIPGFVDSGNSQPHFQIIINPELNVLILGFVDSGNSVVTILGDDNDWDVLILSLVDSGNSLLMFNN